MHLAQEIQEDRYPIIDSEMSHKDFSSARRCALCLEAEMVKMVMFFFS